MDLRRILHRAYGLAMHLHPRHFRGTVKRVLHAMGLLFWFWRARAFARAAVRPFVPRRILATWRFLRALRASLRRRRGESRLTIAVDVSPFWEPLTGIGWYLYRLLEHLADRDDVRLRLYGPNLVDTPDLAAPVVELPRGPALELVRYTVPQDLNISYVRMVGWLRSAQDRLIAADGNRILFAPNYFLPPWFGRATGRLVATVHDLAFLRVPWTMRESTRANLVEHLEATIARATLVLTDAEAVRAELIESGLATPERIRTVHLGAGTVRAGDTRSAVPSPVEGPYVLHVGTIEPRKDLPTLLAAWRRLRADRSSPASPLPTLVLCGRFGWKSEALRAEIEAAAAEGWLVHLGYLDDETVAALYRDATLVVLPSIYEGFGLPAVEAMTSGAPLLCSDIPVLREVAGDGAAFAPAGDVEAWSDTLAGLLDDPEARAVMASAGRVSVQRFDWRRTAEGTVAAWHDAAAARAGTRVAVPAGTSVSTAATTTVSTPPGPAAPRGRES